MSLRVVIVGTPNAAFYGAAAVSGTATDASGNAAAGRLVRLYDNVTGVLIAETTTASDGTWSVADLKVGLVIDVRVFDDVAGTVYNDLVHSRVVVA